MKKLSKRILAFLICGFLLSANVVFGATLFESYTTTQNSNYAPCDNVWVAQTFTPQTAHYLEYANFKLYKAEAGTSTLVVGLRATDENGKPTGGDLDTAITTESVGSMAWRTFYFSNFLLKADTKYAFVFRNLECDSTKIARVSDSPDYEGGSELDSQNSGGAWTPYLNREWLFEEWGEAPFILLPEGILASTTDYITYIFDDVGSVIFLAGGLPLALYVIRKLIRLLV